MLQFSINGNEYFALYLDGKENEEFVPCEICKKINRNIIEPIIIFIPIKELESPYGIKDVEIFNDGSYYIIAENDKAFCYSFDFSNKDLNNYLSDFYKNIPSLNEKKEFWRTCIYHCDKENPIWIKNYEKLLKNNGENIIISWNEKLRREFWKRIRKYRFSIDFFEKFLKYKGSHVTKTKKSINFLKKRSQFIIDGEFDFDFRKFYECQQKVTNKELNERFHVLSFYFENLQTQNLYHDYRYFIFPSFDYYNTPQGLMWTGSNEIWWIGEDVMSYSKDFFTQKEIEIAKECFTVTKLTFNFWYMGECFAFFKDVDFSNSTFLGYVNFNEVIFFGNEKFNNCNYKFFYELEFDDIY